MIFGIRIYGVADSELTNTPLGVVNGEALYCTGDEDVIYSFDKYYYGFLANIKTYSDKIDIKNGGKFAFEGDFSFSLKTYGATQNVLQDFHDNDIYLLGRKVQLIDLTRSEDDGTDRILTTKRIDRVIQSDGELKIKCRGLWHGEDQPFPPDRILVTDDLEETEDTGKVIPRIYGSVRYAKGVKVSSLDYIIKKTTITGSEYQTSTDETRIFISDGLDYNFYDNIRDYGGIVKLERDSIIKDLSYAYDTYVEIAGDVTAWADFYNGFEISIGTKFAEGAYLIADHEINYLSFSPLIDDPLITVSEPGEDVPEDGDDDAMPVIAYSETTTNPFNAAYIKTGKAEPNVFFPVQDAEVAILDKFPISRSDSDWLLTEVEYGGAGAVERMNRSTNIILGTGAPVGFTKYNIKDVENNPFDYSTSNYIYRDNITDPADELDSVNVDGCFMIKAKIPQYYIDKYREEGRGVYVAVSGIFKKGRAYLTTAQNYPSTAGEEPDGEGGSWTIIEDDTSSRVSPAILHSSDSLGNSIFTEDKAYFENLIPKYRPSDSYKGNDDTIVREAQYGVEYIDDASNKFYRHGMGTIGSYGLNFNKAVAWVLSGGVEKLPYDITQNNEILIATQAERIFGIYFYLGWD